jgi:hypothetical protein
MSLRVRIVFRLAALAHLIAGVPLLVTPASWNDRFMWPVSPLVAMTIGAWLVGNAWAALVAARLRRWNLVRAIVFYLLAFGAGQLLVLWRFSDQIESDRSLATPYLAALFSAVVAGVVAVVELVRRHPTPDLLDEPAPRWGRLVVTGLALASVAVAAIAWVGTPFALDATVFPEVVTPITLAAFGASHVALAVGALTLSPVRVIRPSLCYGLAVLGPLGLSAVAIPVFWTSFDIPRQPLQAVYVVTTLVVLVSIVIALVRRRELLRG